MNFNEQIVFRLFQMPCCGHSLCWVNPRLPSYCPSCGKHCFQELRTGAHTAMHCEPAWLKYEAR